MLSVKKDNPRLLTLPVRSAYGSECCLPKNVDLPRVYEHVYKSLTTALWPNDGGLTLLLTDHR